MARIITSLTPQAPFAAYGDQSGWDGVKVAITDLPDGKQLIEIGGAARDQIGGSPDGAVLGKVAFPHCPETTQVGTRAAVRPNGDIVQVGPLDATGGTISFKVAYTV